MAIVPVGSDGKVALYNDAGSQNMIADVEGYFPTGGGYNPLTPTRLYDSRAATPLAPGETRKIPIAGQAPVPATGVGSVVLNVTATAGTAATFLSVNPASSTNPTSNLNVGPAQTIPNLVIAKVATDGSISVYNASGSQHVVIDVFGWMPDNAGYTSMAPYRALDTRVAPATALGPNGTVDVQIGGVGTVPTTGVDSVVVNITATGGTAATSIKAYATGLATPPAVSNIPVAPGETVPNLAIVKVGTGGKITLANQNGTQNLVVDIQGYFSSAAAGLGVTPATVGMVPASSWSMSPPLT